MSADTYTYTPPVWADGVEPDTGLAYALARSAKDRAWTPPKGHASWCVMEQPPHWRPVHLGDTKMAEPTCTCPKNSTARRLRALAGVAC